MSTNLKSLA